MFSDDVAMTNTGLLQDKLNKVSASQLMFSVNC